ncbi:hypothetical protein IscW_ISCW016142, partial [Ixodes scapularis]
QSDETHARKNENKIWQNYGPQSRPPPAHHGTDRLLVRIQQKSLYRRDDKRRALPPPEPRCVFPRST